MYTIAKHHVEKGLQHAYRDRRRKKREFRHLWIVRINAAARVHGVTYSKLMHSLKEKRVDVNRKVLADLAARYPEAFSELVRFALA